MVVSLQEQYDRLCKNTCSDIYEHLPTFLATAAKHRPPEIIELGVRAGCSTIAWLHAVDQFGGHLWSVDGASPCRDDDDTDLLGPYMTLDRDYSNLQNWTFIKGWDSEDWVLSSLPNQVDIVFVDTNHTYEMTTYELENFVPRVRPGGLLLFHDTNIEVTGNATTPQPRYPVWMAIEDYCSEHQLRRSYVDYSMGLGTIYV